MEENKNMKGIKREDKQVVIGYVEKGKQKIRVGEGGVMMKKNQNMVIEEKLGKIDQLFKGRIDFGIGREKGKEKVKENEIRRNMESEENEFKKDVVEMIKYLKKEEKGKRVREVKGEGLKVNVWILG